MSCKVVDVEGRKWVKMEFVVGQVKFVNKLPPEQARELAQELLASATQAEQQQAQEEADEARNQAECCE